MEQSSSGNGQKTGRKKRKSFGQILKKRFSKASYILGKIKENESKGVSNPMDYRDRKRLEFAILEYQQYVRTRDEWNRLKMQTNVAQEESAITVNKQWGVVKSQPDMKKDQQTKMVQEKRVIVSNQGSEVKNPQTEMQNKKEQMKMDQQKRGIGSNQTSEVKKPQTEIQNKEEQTKLTQDKREEKGGISSIMQFGMKKSPTQMKNKIELTKMALDKRGAGLKQTCRVKQYLLGMKKEELAKVDHEKKGINANQKWEVKKSEAEIKNEEEQTKQAQEKKAIGPNQKFEMKKSQLDMKKKEEPTKMTQHNAGIALNKQIEVKAAQTETKTKEGNPATSSIPGKNNLCLALVNEKGGTIQPVTSQWPLIEKRVSDIQYKYNLHNISSPIPRYDASKTYRGYRLLQFRDKFSKECLCNCIGQVKDEFKGLSLNLVEIDKIPKENKNTKPIANTSKSSQQPPELSNETLPPTPPPPSPPDWRKLSASTSAIDRHRHYLRCLDRMKIYAFKRTLTRNEKRNERKCRRSIRKYEERNGLPPTQTVEDGNGQQNVQSFQLSVNYIERNSSGGFREQMAQISQSSWCPQTSSNNFSNNQQNSLNCGGNDSWNYEQMSTANNQQMSGKSSLTRPNFGGVNSSTPSNNYGFGVASTWRPESSWNNSASETESLFERRQKSSCEFVDKQKPNSSWNFKDPPKESFNEMREIGKSQEFNFKRGNNFDQGSNEMKQPEQNFSSNTKTNRLWNDYKPEFESSHGIRGNSSTNCQKLNDSFSARNNLETEQTWSTKQRPNTAWNYDKTSESNYMKKTDNYGCPNPQIRKPQLLTESSNSPQQFSSFAAIASRNSSNNFEENSQSIKQPRSLAKKSTTDEDSAKSRLEKQIYELLNVLSGENAEEERQKLPNTPTTSQPNLQNARENLTQSWRKRKSDEVITLSDDSDNEEETKAEKEYFKAVGYLAKLEGRNGKSLSEQEKFLKETSEFVVRQYESKFCSKLNKTNQAQEKSNENKDKRTRWSSSTNTSTLPQATGSSYKGFSQPNTSVNPALWNSSTALYPSVRTNPELQIAIIDRHEADLRIPKRLWSQLESNLLKALHHEVERTNNTQITQFDGMHWKYGVKIIQCENMEALNFIKRFIIKESLQNISQLYDVIPISELPKRSIVKVWIPPPNADDKAILQIIKAQNHTLYTNCWTLINSRERPNKNGKDLYISISATSVERLRFCQGEIRYGINRLKMELPEEQDFGGGEEQ